MRILLATSELHPYSKTGGLADMVGALGKYLALASHQVGVVTPLYRGIRQKYPAIKPLDWQMHLPLGDRWVDATVETLEPIPNLTIYFINQPGFYDRSSPYQESGVDFPDNAERFVFFAKAVTQLARYLPLQPEVVHMHDWQTGLVPLFIKHQAEREGWGNAPRSLFTIHNLAYHGLFTADKFALTNLPAEYMSPTGLEFYAGMNCLKAGIVYTDLITTVSPRYAREITTEQFGCGLDGVLRGRQNALVGILNGVDYDEWNTDKNPFLAQPFSAEEPDGKAACKAALQKELGLPVRPDAPLFGNISRLVEQKGTDLILGALEEMVHGDLQFIQLGSGATVFEQALLRLAKRHPDKVAVKIGYDHGLSHRIEAGCDFYLMPSQFEPCGLNQLYSLRYGSLPIVRTTGGLDDSVIDYTQDQEKANGIKFQEHSPRALAKAIRKALALYREPQWLEYYRHNAMTADFSWGKTAQDYLEIYQRLID